MTIAPETTRVTGPGIIPHVETRAGDAVVRVFPISHNIEARAESVDGIFLLPELYVTAAREAKLFFCDLVADQ